MRDEGCAAVAVLGGDGTNRAVVKGWQDIVVLPVSTGTNNAFPIFVEPTVAGTSLAMVARGVVDVDEVTTTAKLVHLELAGGGADLPDDAGTGDIALIDAVAVADPYVGSLELFDPDTMRLAVLTRADPAAIGFAAVGGLLEPVAAADDAGAPGAVRARGVGPRHRRHSPDGSGPSRPHRCHRGAAPRAGRAGDHAGTGAVRVRRRTQSAGCTTASPPPSWFVATDPG